MEAFSPQFKAIIDTDLGQAILNFLKEEKTIVMMETATYLSRPAVEAIVPALNKRFGTQIEATEKDSEHPDYPNQPQNPNNPENINYDRLKQTIGHMVKVIMTEQGYVIDQNNVKISKPRNELFSRATRYKKPSSEI